MPPRPALRDFDGAAGFADEPSLQIGEPHSMIRDAVDAKTWILRSGKTFRPHLSTEWGLLSLAMDSSG
jgi:hypothetical protein